MWTMLLRLVNARRMRAILAWFVVSAILQGATLALMIPFLRALYGRSDSLVAWLIAVVVLGVVTVAVDTTAMYRSYRVSVFEVCDTMIDRVAEHVLALPLGWFNAQREAAVVNATSKEVNTLSHLTSMVIPNLCNAFIVPLVMLVATAFVEWPLALIMAITIVPLALTWRLMLAATTRANEMEDSASADAAGRLVEFARLQAVLRATGATETGWEPLRATLDADSEATLAGLRIKGRPAQAFNLIVNLAFALVMAAGLSAVSGHGLDVVAYLAIVTVASRMLLPLTRAALFSTEADGARVALRAMRSILDAEPLPEPAPEERARPEGTTIALTDVSFSYDEGRPVLKDVSLTAPQGRVTALVGPSGAGKSTILRLAARFWDVGSGAVTIGGADVRALPTSEIMGMTSMVFQDVYLFDDTLAANVRVGDPNATEEQVRRAADLAGVTEVVDRLPHGWDTRVGEGGRALSGGERQRVSIARALLKRAPIVLLDEATSALDAENEANIVAAMEELRRTSTLIVIAHKLETIAAADQVVVLDDAGRIAQRGHHNELVSVEGPYRSFWEQRTRARGWALV